MEDNLKELEEALEAMRSAGNVKAAVIEKYESVVGIYKEKMKEFRHKGKWFLFIVTIIFMACSEKIIWACKV